MKTKYLASGNVLDGELAEAGKDKDAALLHLEGADGLEGVKGHAGLLAREAGESNLKRYLRISQNLLRTSFLKKNLKTIQTIETL